MVLSNYPCYWIYCKLNVFLRYMNKSWYNSELKLMQSRNRRSLNKTDIYDWCLEDVTIIKYTSCRTNRDLVISLAPIPFPGIFEAYFHDTWINMEHSTLPLIRASLMGSHCYLSSPLPLDLREASIIIDRINHLGNTAILPRIAHVIST